MEDLFEVHLVAPVGERRAAIAARLASQLRTDAHKLEALLAKGPGKLTHGTRRAKAEALAERFREAGLPVEVVAVPLQAFLPPKTTEAVHEPSRRRPSAALADVARPKLVYKQLLVLLALVSFALWWLNRPTSIEPGPGVLAPLPPVQKNLLGEEARPWLHDGYLFIPLARYELQARVLAKKHYAFGHAAELSPLDLVLGWGPMSDSEVLSEIAIRQDNRWYFWWAKEPPIPLRDIELNSANTHMVPANAEVARQLGALRVGEVVKMTGYLLEITGDDGFSWKSSLTRGDTGAGACELFWVEALHLDLSQAP